MRLLIAACVLFLASCAGPTYNGIAPAEFNEKLTSGDYNIVDLYKPKEGRTEMIQGAYLLDTESKEARMKMKEDLDIEKPILLYCQNGKGATRFMQHLESQGYPAVNQLEGGLNAWKAEGLPVVALAK